ncbi:MAG: metal ABC transporter ATP-binding protein [Firmicutes bacterium]|jgi:zinc transport system ATP-binding protein|nr:metal ABC transporter ATP-binding protein [Bacillota bacterium]
MDLIKLNNVSYSIDRKAILRNINLQINRNDFIGVIGPNGGGKTTLIKILLGIIKPSEGKVLSENGLNVKYVPQFSNFEKTFPIKVIDVVLSGLERGNLKPFRRYSKEEKEYAMSLLEKLEIGDLKDRQIGGLSGGQMQKVLILRGIISKPDLILLDEPTASIDTKSKNTIYSYLKELNKDMAIFLVTHDMAVISSYVKTVGCLNIDFHYHNDKQLDQESLEKTFGCPIDLIAHGYPHRVLPKHWGDIE